MSKIKANIYINDTIIKKEYNKGITLLEISNTVKDNYTSKIVAGIVNNNIKELNFKIEENCDIKFLDLSTLDGIKIYERGLSFIFIKAVKEVIGESTITIEHSLSKGLYCEIKYSRDINEKDIHAVEKRMKEISKEDIPFIKENVPLNEAVEIFKEQGMESQVKLLRYRNREDINIYKCGWLKNYFYGYMVPSTGYIDQFELKYYSPGVILRYPKIYNNNSCQIPEFVEQKKLFNVFRESENWGKLMKIPFVADLNERIETNTYNEIIRISEALHEKKIAKIADMITNKRKRIILIAGPSSSGKTTFAQRLAIQLKVNGLKPIALSTDDYFVERDRTPIDRNGEYDFEALEAVDLDLFNDNLTEILNGKLVEVPTFNFLKGKREYTGKRVQISQDQPIIIEGIHSLNDRLTSKISKEDKFKIYISALTQLNIDNHNRIPTTDLRLIRRIVRDSKYRGHSAKRTLELWKAVRSGEEKNIFPYQENADVMFNSSLIYELAVLKKYIEPLLKEITQKDKEFSEAKRLLKFLSYFLSIDDENAILNNSIIKEFIGGSCF